MNDLLTSLGFSLATASGIFWVCTAYTFLQDKFMGVRPEYRQVMQATNSFLPIAKMKRARRGRFVERARQG